MDDADVSMDELEAEIDTNWLMDVCLDLAPGMRVRMDRCVGDVPIMLARTEHSRLAVGFGLGNVEDLDAVHVRLSEEFAVAARALADEICELVARRYSVPET